MLKFSNPRLALLALALLAGCQSLPQPTAETGPVVTPEPASEITATTPPAQPAPEPVDLDRLHYEEALLALKNNDAETAVIILEQLAIDAPDKPHLYTNLGLAHFRLQQSDAAEFAFIEAIDRNPDDAVAYNHLGILLRRKGQFQDALRQYQRALEIDANYATAHLNLGILFDLYLQDLGMALQHYQSYRSLSDGEDKKVDGWIVDIERRLKTAES